MEKIFAKPPKKTSLSFLLSRHFCTHYSNKCILVYKTSKTNFVFFFFNFNFVLSFNYQAIYLYLPAHVWFSRYITAINITYSMLLINDDDDDDDVIQKLLVCALIYLVYILQYVIYTSLKKSKIKELYCLICSC